MKKDKYQDKTIYQDNIRAILEFDIIPILGVLALILVILVVLLGLL